MPLIWRPRQSNTLSKFPTQWLSVEFEMILIMLKSCIRSQRVRVLNNTPVQKKSTLNFASAAVATNSENIGAKFASVMKQFVQVLLLVSVSTKKLSSGNSSAFQNQQTSTCGWIRPENDCRHKCELVVTIAG